MRKATLTTMALFCGVSLAACSAQIDGSSAVAGPTKAPPPEFDQPAAPAGGLPFSPDTVMIPIKHSSSGSAAEDQAFTTYAAPAGGKTIFVNRGGGTWVAGQDDSSRGVSSIVQYQGLSQASIAPLSWDDAKWQSFLSCIKDEYGRFNVNVTDQRPAGGPYIEAVIGGSGYELNFAQGIGGIAPVDTYYCRPISGAVVYIFAEKFGPQTSCEIAAQEIGHAIVPLDHEYLSSDPMTYLGNAGHKTFQDVDANCGEYSTRACFCNRPSQNSVQLLTQWLGAKTGGTTPTDPTQPTQPTQPTNPTPPTTTEAVSIVSPANDATVQGNGIIDVTIQSADPAASVWLYWNYLGRYLPCDNSQAVATCTHTGNTFKWSINVGTGDRMFYATAVDAAGNQVLTKYSYTVHLSGTAANPPPVQAPPQVRVDGPAEGTVFHRGDPMTIQAAITSQATIAEVLVNWKVPSGDVYTFAAHETSPGEWTSSLPISSSAVLGPRVFTITANDTAGNKTTSAPVNLTVQ